MGKGFTSLAARNIFYGGTLFFILPFAVLILDTESRIPAWSQATLRRRRWCWRSACRT